MPHNDRGRLVAVMKATQGQAAAARRSCMAGGRINCGFGPLIE